MAAAMATSPSKSAAKPCNLSSISSTAPRASRFSHCYAPIMPHTLRNPPARLLEKYARRPVAQAKYLAMIERSDETIDPLAAYTDRNGFNRQQALRLRRRQRLGSTRGPVVAVRGPRKTISLRCRPPNANLLPRKGKIKPTRDETTLGSSLDLAPAILAAAGRKPRPTALVSMSATDGNSRAGKRFSAPVSSTRPSTLPVRPRT